MINWKHLEETNSEEDLVGKTNQGYYIDIVKNVHNEWSIYLQNKRLDKTFKNREDAKQYIENLIL